MLTPQSPKPPQKRSRSVPFGSSTASVRGVLAMLLGFQAPLDELLPSVGIELATLEDEDARIDVDTLVKLWNATSRSLNDPFLGIHAALWVDRAMELGAFGVVDFIASHSGCVEEAMRKYCRYNQIMSYPHPRDEITIVDESMLFRRHLPDTSPELLRQPTEAFLASLVLRIRRLTGVYVTPSETRFRHAQPENTDAYKEVFGDRIVFNADLDVLVFEPSTRTLPLRTANSWLCEILEQHARELVQALDENGAQTSSQVRRVLLQGPRANSDTKAVVDVLRHSSERSGLEMPEMPEVARILGTSVRTMQRRLGEEGTSFQQVRDEVRKELAARYTRDRSMALGDIAFLLGFSTEASFHQAFKRWFGQTPGAFRLSDALRRT